jgi:hypothetical protein
MSDMVKYSKGQLDARTDFLDYMLESLPRGCA